MTIIALPDELPLDPTAEIQVYDYCSTQAISKQQIVLKRNAFSFLMEGTKEVIFNNASITIDSSQFLVMKSGHCLMTEKISDVKRYQSVLLFFSDEILLKLLHKHDLGKKRAVQADQAVHAFEYDEFIKRIINSVLDAASLSKQTQKKLFEIKLEEIILYLLESYGNHFVHALLANQNDQTQKFIQTIERNQLNKLSLKELAFLCDMSVSTFKRTFEKQYSESPIKWFLNKRLEYAHHLLLHTKKNSSDIYLEIGYENLSSFIQAYKSKYGITPKQHQTT